jgi:hypothetical protein
MREERRLRVFENKVLRRIFNKIEKNEMGGACSAYGGRDVYRVLVGTPEGRPRRR